MHIKGTWNLGIVIIFVSTVLLLSLEGLFVPIISRSQLSYFPPSQRQVQPEQQQSSGNQVSIINSITGNDSKVIIEPKISIPYSLAVTKIIGYKDNLSNSVRNGIYSNKVVILNFYDDIKSQFTNAKPILDKYGFKSTFFIVCNWAGSEASRMTWQDINQLYREGHDIESHSMTHHRLNKLSASSLDYELGRSKQCLHDHLGINATIFSPPHSAGWNNVTVINTIAKYYDLSIGGFVNDVMFLHCYGWKNHQQHFSQTDCRTYSNNGILNFANRYDIKETTHNALDDIYLHNDSQIFDKFVELVNSQAKFNKNGTINAVPIVSYHSIDNKRTTTSTDINLFADEMKYLHDNGLRVITMSDLGYDENSNDFYIKK
jgi:peptidoglycan/xylan/chitin deacetylase (PgdA/CDA1 family)